MIDVVAGILRYPGYTLYAITVIFLLIRGVAASHKYRSWKPLLIYISAIAAITLLGLVLGLALLGAFT